MHPLGATPPIETAIGRSVPPFSPAAQSCGSVTWFRSHSAALRQPWSASREDGRPRVRMCMTVSTRCSLPENRCCGHGRRAGHVSVALVADLAASHIRDADAPGPPLSAMEDKTMSRLLQHFHGHIHSMVTRGTRGSSDRRLELCF
jgi:hypothetical protein